MKLQEYFDKKKEIIVSGWDKLEIYQNFISKKNTKSFYPQRQFFFVKSFAYSLVLCFLLLWLYWTYIFNWKFIINKDWFFIQRSNWIKSVQADYVAKIIEFNGNFYIWHSWQYYQWSYISNWDIVTLQDWAELVFNINQWTKAKVVWPAKFLITKSNSWYKLNLIYWDFIELKSLETKNPQNLEFATQNFTIKQSDKTKPISFQLVRQWEKTLLKNNWSLLIITQNTDDKTQTQKELNSDKVLSIQTNDISIINYQNFSQAIAQKNFTQTLSFNNSQNNTNNIDDILNKDYSQDTNTDDQINNNIWLPNDKLIPTEEQMWKLNSNLIESSLSNIIENIKKQNLQPETQSTSTDIDNLENKIEQISTSFNVNYVKTSWSTTKEKLSQLKNNIDKLLSILQEKYHIPPTYISKIQNISADISKILH